MPTVRPKRRPVPPIPPDSVNRRRRIRLLQSSYSVAARGRIVNRPPRPQRVLNGKRAVILIVAVGLFAGAVFGANWSMVRRNADALLRQARKAEEEGNTKDALRLYTDY